MSFDENDEKIKTKSKMIAVTTLSIIGVIIVFLIIGMFSIKSITNEFFRHKENYCSLDINDSNKEQIVSLLKDKNTQYCESIYKIEYVYSFPHSENIIIYCKDDNQINLYKDNNSELIEYIRDNGEKGER